MAPRSLRSLAIKKQRATSPGPPSPTFSEGTRVSAMDFGSSGPEKIITRADLKSSMAAYESLMQTSSEYRAALVSLSQHTSAFAAALENVSSLKGPSYECGTRLQASSGLHHLIGNHWHVLANTLDVNFERPLRQHLETYKTIVNERSSSYERALQEKSRIIRQTEARSMNKRERNLQSFRESLNVLQRQVDELDDLKAAHYTEIMEHEEEVWDVVQAKTCVVVRSTMDVFDRFTAKASDPTIESMLQSVPDPFDSYVPQGESSQEDQIFSILQPLAIISNAPSPSPSPLIMTPESDDESRTSWTPHSSGFFPDSEWSDAPSPTDTPPRSVSPPTQRHSQPGHQSRKSESKLRSVLAVIDESHSRQGSHEGADHPVEGLPSTNGNGNGKEASWSSSFFGGPSSSGAVTPRNSALFAASTPSEDPDMNGNRSPRSDHTINPPAAA